ncbi:hypothetical protein [Deinococcus hopiensis]|uniref:Uncharacterized protein n=1 Tax=Deinococcus hopiensis KR-140 TaxID=695939 RepID=A0A1W1UAH8_9DEIO|nr:hypothetical protein [Deinococcus hopiensis]SMB78108.1 hypothetical protein SAMN00790413_06491 [Deinococcus hopiensis KR-140]
MRKRLLKLVLVGLVLVAPYASAGGGKGAGVIRPLEEPVWPVGG